MRTIFSSCAVAHANMTENKRQIIQRKLRLHHSINEYETHQLGHILFSLVTRDLVAFEIFTCIVQADSVSAMCTSYAGGV